jgi:5-formyltetrahydrofolate cyclo-ligase
MIKSKLRKIYLSKQNSLSKSERREKSLQIKERFFANFDLDNVEVLHLFLSIAEKGEIDTSPFFDELRQRFSNIKTVVPRVDFERDVLEHLEINASSQLKVNHWGISEPVGDELIDEKKIDLVLVPMLCFDERGFRVGHGKGYYDKFLSLCREDTRKIGLSFFESIRRISDVNEFDVKLDFCITPEKIYHFAEVY